MKRATMSFEMKRQALLHAAEQKSKGTGQTKHVVFASEAVPQFLEALRKYQEDSRKVRIMAR
jgi:hypothetical protein